MKRVLVVIEMDENQQNKLKTDCKNVHIEYKNRKEVTLDYLETFDGVVGNLTPKLLNESKNVKWVHLESAGVERYLNIPEHILLTNSTGAYGEAISEYMIAGVFTVFKKFDKYIKAQSKHSWDYLGMVKQVANSKVLVVGLGDIGTAFARKMNALGCKVSGVKRSISNKPDFIEEIYTFENMAEVIGKFDIVALSLPYTKETKKIFDYNMIKKMKKDVLLINVGRGKTVDTDGLIKALDENHLLGAVLDVVDPEPLPINSKLWNYDNVVITPHVSGNYSMGYTLEQVLEIATENINKFNENTELLNPVDRALGYKGK